MIEPVQGEGGFVVAPPEFMEGMRRICDDNGIVLIVDEVQTGFGRTGKLFAIEHYGVEPDLITVAKSIAAGLPLSGVLGRAEIMDAPGPNAIGGTYVGNPVAQAAALAVLDVIDEEGLVERAAAIGETIRARMLALAGALRARSATSAGSARCSRSSSSTTASRRTRRRSSSSAVCDEAFRNGLLLLSAGIYSQRASACSCRSRSPTPSSTRRSASGKQALEHVARPAPSSPRRQGQFRRDGR